VNWIPSNMFLTGTPVFALDLEGGAFGDDELKLPSFVI